MCLYFVNVLSCVFPFQLKAYCHDVILYFDSPVYVFETVVFIMA